MKGSNKGSIYYIQGFLDGKNECSEYCQLVNGFGPDDVCDCGAEDFVEEARKHVQDMSPRKAPERFLLSHPESDALFEVFSKEEAEKSISEWACDDVTGVEYYENFFKEMSKNETENKK